MAKSLTNETMMVLTSYDTWSYLVARKIRMPRHRYTRAEAFYDLLRRQRLMVVDGSSNDFIDASLQDLSIAWRWDRGTVQRFIDGLQEKGAVITSLDRARNNKTLIRVNNISGLTPVKEDRPQVKTIDSESASDSTISGRTPTTQGGHGARQDDSYYRNAPKGARAPGCFTTSKPNYRFWL